MTPQQLADETIKAIRANQGFWARLTRKKPELDTTQIAEVMHEIAKRRGASMMSYPQAVEIVIDKLS